MQQKIPAPNNDAFELRRTIEEIANRLCLAVSGEFDFTLEIHSTDQSIQKLGMLVNFVLDAARRALADINEKNARLTELDKLKSDFMANISHEIRTPLTLILGPLDRLVGANDQALSQDQISNIQRIQRNALRLYVLVNDLLDFSKIEAGKFVIHKELIDVNELISQIVSDAQGLAEDRKLVVNFLPCAEIGMGLFDRKMFEKIILNLLSNALKFTPEGGRIDIELSKQENNLQLIVKDTGIGIPPSQMQHLFERFHQIDSSSTRAHEGTGIGLALIQQFANLMHGKITIDSAPKKGSKFTVVLPLTTVSEAQKNKETSVDAVKSIRASLSNLMGEKKLNSELSATKNEGKLPRILIAEDNIDMRSYIISILKATYEVLVAENGQVALEMIHKFHPQVVLTDMMMPVMDGFQLTKILKADAQTKDIPVIIITAKVGREAVFNSFETGADDYIPKPFSAEELIARTRSAVHSYQVHKRNVALNNQLIMAARRAGMSDIATSVLHNIGNVLNSVKVSAGILHENINNHNFDKFSMISGMIQDNMGNIGEFLSSDPKGKLLPEYLVALVNHINAEYEINKKEIHGLIDHIKHIEDIVLMQKNISGLSGISEKIHLPEVIDNALQMCASSLENKNIQIEKDFGDTPAITTDKAKLLQILVNLIQNAKDSLSMVNSEIEKKITIQTELNKISESILISVHDNGIGIKPVNMTKIFSFGFTTKKNGHGFGLHSSALAAKELGGKIQLKSDGLEKGAVFILSLPMTEN